MYNNYGYNPYQNRYIGVPQPPMQQQMLPTQMSPPQTNTLNGKQVESVDVVKAMDIPLDGSISYFPIADGSAIITKQLGMDGTSKTIIYKPTQETKKEEPKYITIDDFDELKEQLEDLKEQIKELKKKKKSDVNE